MKLEGKEAKVKAKMTSFVILLLLRDGTSLNPTFPLLYLLAPLINFSQVNVYGHRAREINLSSTDLHLHMKPNQRWLLRDEGLLTPLVLMQQIVVDEQDTELAGPQTCAEPLPLQQYGEPEVQRFWAMGFCEGQLAGDPPGGVGGVGGLFRGSGMG